MATHPRVKRVTGLVSKLATILALAAPLAPVPQARGGDWMPLLPDQDFYDFQLFAPPDLQEYEMYPEPSEGIFFSYDRLAYGITVPRVTGVGRTDTGGYLIPTQPISPQTLVQLNNGNIQAGAQAGGGSGAGQGGSIIGGIYIFGGDPMQLDLNTSWMRTKIAWGNRFEGGWIYDNRGVLLSYTDMGSQSQSFQTNSEFAASSPTQTFTQETASGTGTTGGIGQAIVTTTITSESPPPDHLISQKLTQNNNTEIQSGGVAMMVRRELGRRGSGTNATFTFGPRYIQVADRFNIGYESNQYAFNNAAAGGGGGGGGGGVNQGGGGANQGGGNNQGGGGGQGGGNTNQGGGNNQGGGGGLNGGGQFGGANGNQSIIYDSGPAGNVLGITGVDTLTGQGFGTPLQTGAWNTNTYNNMVGPEFGMLFESNYGRFTFTSGLKFTAAFNWQNNLYQGSNFPEGIGADYLRATFTPSTTYTSDGTNTGAPQTIAGPPLFLQVYGVGQSNTTNSASHQFVFSPIGEWRFGGQYKVSQAINLRAGYTGMWLGSIARASTNTGYVSSRRPVQYAEPQDASQPASLQNPWVVKTSTPTGADGTQVSPTYNRIGPVVGGQEDVFINGVDFGVEVKY
jgi:hypothetical protein